MSADANQPPGAYPPPGPDAAGTQLPAYGTPATPPGAPGGYDQAQYAPGAYGAADAPGQAPVYPQPAPQKKGSVLPWIVAVVFLLTTVAGFGWAVSLKSTSDKRQSELSQAQARITQLDSEIKTLNKELEEAKGLTKDQQSTLGKSKQIADQMYQATIQAAKEVNQIIVEFNNVIARFNANDIAGANAAINQANKNIELMKAQLAKIDELAAQFEKTIGNV